MNTPNRRRLSVVAVLAAALLLVGLLPAAVPASAAASLQLSQNVVPTGGKVSVTGSGFTGGDAVAVYADVKVHGTSQRVQTSTTAGGDGTITAALSLPGGTDAGFYTLTAKDTHGASASIHFTVLPYVMLQVSGTAPTITVVDQHGFFVDGVGFKSGETVKIQAVFTAYSGNNIVENRTATVNNIGRFWNVRMNAPAGAKSGNATVTATEATSGKTVKGFVDVTYRPYIFLSSKSARAGTSVTVNGRGFVANTRVRVVITIPGSNGTSVLVQVIAYTDGVGAFAKPVFVPKSTAAGTYTISALDMISGLRRFARLAITSAPAPKPTATPTPRATATSTPKPIATPTPTPKPVFHAFGQVFPAVTLPNQNVTFSGHGFPANTAVTVSVMVALRSGGHRYLSTSTFTDNNGSFTIAFRVPYKTAAGTYLVTARSSRAQVTHRLRVLPMSAHPRNLTFRWISLWYHTVRHGTWDYVVVQSSLTTTLGIWVHVIFPNGQHWDFYTNTNHGGRWAVRFAIPGNGVSNRSNHAYMTFQLWHGHQTTQSFMDFTLV